MTSRMLYGFISLSTLTASATGCFGDVTLGAFVSDSGAPIPNTPDASTDAGKKTDPAAEAGAVVDGGVIPTSAGWIDRTGASSPAPIPNGGWSSVASDSTGLKVVAVSSLADIWTSTNAGVDWTNRTKGTLASGMDWTSVASDSTGTKLVAVATPEGLYTDAGVILTGGNIWTSTDSGVTWINRTSGTAAETEQWSFVTSDSTGTHLVAIDGGRSEYNNMWTSSDAGVNWTNVTAGTAAENQAWESVASDSTGSHLVAVSNIVTGNSPTGEVEGDIWTSTNYGVTWTNETATTSLTAKGWVSVASDSSGAHLVALADGQGVWGSSDFGHTWAKQNADPTVNPIWTAVASDATGTHLVAAAESKDIWVSSDSGSTWTNQTVGTSAANKGWSCVASDATGNHLIASTQGQDIWTNK